MGFILLIAMFVGLLLYFSVSNTKWAWVGQVLFASSVLALLIALAPRTVALLGH